MASNGGNVTDFDCFFHKLTKIAWPPNHVDDSRSLAKLLSNEEPDYADDIMHMVSESQSQSKSVIQVGNYFDVSSLLSSCSGSYLVRNNGERVEVNEETFRSKHVFVCCFYVPVLRDNPYCKCIQALATICHNLYNCTNRVVDFEIVMVAKMNRKANYEDVFDHFFGGFPARCLAVPFEDARRRDYICKYLDLGRPTRRCFPCLLLDDKGIVLPFRPSSLDEYGIEAFPSHIVQECDQLLRLRAFLNTYTPLSAPKLEEIFKCSPSHVLYKIYRASGSRKKVCISKLNERLVGLYLCSYGNLIRTLHKLHKQCKTRRLEIEIVVVYLPFVGYRRGSRAFQEHIDKQLRKRKVSWWRFPFNNFVCRRFWGLTSGYPGDRLLIVGPHGKYVDLYGGDVMEAYGIDAYPFTRETILRSEMSKVRALTLDSLAYGSRDHVVQGNDRRITVRVEELKGRNIFLYYNSFDNIDIDDLYHKELTSWYYCIKSKVPDFEVVFVASDDTNTVKKAKERAEILSAMPWLICPWHPDHSASLDKLIGGVFHESFIGFGKDGRACTIRHPTTVTSIGPEDFPLLDQLREDFIEQLKDNDLDMYDM